MSNNEEIKKELRKEIKELEMELEEKKAACKPVMVPGMPGSVGMVERMGTYEQRMEIERLEREIERKTNLLETFEAELLGKHDTIPRFDKNAHLLPEYREGGYFTSQDFYDKCDEFHRTLAEQGIEDIFSLPRNEYIFLKKQFLQEKYGIIWLAEEYQYEPGTWTDIHISPPDMSRGTYRFPEQTVTPTKNKIRFFEGLRFRKNKSDIKQKRRDKKWKI